jgi:hypothetical protein
MGGWMGRNGQNFDDIAAGQPFRAGRRGRAVPEHQAVGEALFEGRRFPSGQFALEKSQNSFGLVDFETGH